MVKELTAENFEKAINSKLPVIVDFWASWCGPCKMLTPIFENVSKDYEGNLEFAKLSTEDYPEVAANNMVAGIPCLIIFNKGEEISRIIGFMMKDSLKRKIDEILNKI